MPIERAFMSRSGGARRDLRFELRLAASLRIASGLAPISLLDVSRGGALAEAQFAPAAGSRVVLLLERLEVEARVVWVRGAQFGLAFDRQISATELFFQLGRSRAAAEADGDPRMRLRSAVSA